MIPWSQFAQFVQYVSHMAATWLRPLPAGWPVASPFLRPISQAPRRIVVLGSTGSIGLSTLNVADSLRPMLVPLGLSAHRNHELLQQQALRWNPRWVTVTGSCSSIRPGDL